MKACARDASLVAFIHWVGVQFTAIHGTQTACWPLNPVWDSKYNHARRRLSIAPKDIHATINAIANDNVLAEKKARARRSGRSGSG
jgi:hypothetical protein